MNKVGGAVAVLAVAVLGLSACGSGEPATDQSAEAAELVVYSGRSEELVGPLIEQFEAASGVQAEVRYGDTAELAAQLLEEGDNSPADIFFAQDAGALQVIEDEGLATSLPADVVKKVPANFRSADDQWVGTSGRARVIVYNTDLVPAEGFLTPCSSWSIPLEGQVGIAPTNASFQAFVTAMRVSVGEEDQAMARSSSPTTQTFENNLAILDAVNAGTVELGLANHYYLFEKAAEVGAENLAVRNAAFQSGDPGNLVNVAGAAVLTSGADNAASEQFVDFLLSGEAQYFAEETSEYPLVEGSPPAKICRPCPRSTA